MSRERAQPYIEFEPRHRVPNDAYANLGKSWLSSYTEYSTTFGVKQMANAITCPTCGESHEIPTCPSCGADLLPHGESDPPLHAQDQTLQDHDQNASDQDQTWSDRDQTASDQDQQSADEDQQAADEDVEAGGDRSSYRHTSKARRRSAEDRETVSTMRDENADARLQTATDRDLAATMRDHMAAQRDRRAVKEDSRRDVMEPEDVLLRAEADRVRAAADRARAAEDRALAAADRQLAAKERAEAFKSREELTVDLKLAATDPLTGVRMRKLGLEEISHEIERANRTGATLLLAFLDIDGLKRVNDKKGHLAGDDLLKRTGEALLSQLRPYDVVVRFGGDEFLCAMPNLPKAEASERLTHIARGLEEANDGHSFTFGLAEAQPPDNLTDLIARADADLLTARRGRRRSA